jgi:hypothetical protein
MTENTIFLFRQPGEFLSNFSFGQAERASRLRPLQLLKTCSKDFFFKTKLIVEYMAARKKLNSVALVYERTIPTERPPLVGEVSAKFCG